MITYRENHEYDKESISRYKMYRVINNDDDNSIYLETFNQVKSTWENEQGNTYHIVTKDEENRLDIIANKFYNNPSYGWIIALVNQIIDPFVIPADTVLIIPSMSSLFKLKNHILD